MKSPDTGIYEKDESSKFDIGWWLRWHQGTHTDTPRLTHIHTHSRTHTHFLFQPIDKLFQSGEQFEVVGEFEETVNGVVKTKGNTLNPLLLMAIPWRFIKISLRFLGCLIFFLDFWDFRYFFWDFWGFSQIFKISLKNVTKSYFFRVICPSVSPFSRVNFHEREKSFSK